MKIFILIFCIKLVHFDHTVGSNPVAPNPNFNQSFYWNGQSPNVPSVWNNGQTPNFNGNSPPSWNGQTPNFNGNNPPNWNGSPSYNPPDWSQNPSTFEPQNPTNWNGNQEPNEIETFYEIGSPMSTKIKRDVKFPEDDDENDKNLSTDDDDNGIKRNTTIDDMQSESVSVAFDGRALKQTMQSVTKIDVGPESQLFVAPGSTSVIYFEVTNLRNEPTYHSFNVQDEKRFLRQMEPRFFLLMPNQRETVRVTILVPQGTELGMKDKITLTSLSLIQAQQSVVVTVTSNGVVDSWQPRVWYTYSRRCDWRWNCVGGIWSIEVVARDYETGMLSIRSNPEGLLLRAPFTAGTNEEVHATYSASCCEPKVAITAYDLNRNQRTIQLDVNWPWLSEYGIATVVLACLFFILLIILIVIWVRWCIKRRQVNEHNLEGPIH